MPIFLDQPMSDRKMLPRVVIMLFVIDFLLCFSYGANFLIGRPYDQVTRLVDLRGEMNLPTWYSSMKWFFVSFLFGIFSLRNLDRSDRRSWVLLFFPLIFLAFSIDEVAGIHEWMGKKTDVFLPAGKRTDTFFRETGIWFFVVGVPVLSFCLFVLWSMRIVFHSPPHVFRKMLIGILIFFGGAIGAEVLSNIPEKNSFGFVLENILEEGMEMAGTTVLFWAAGELLMAHGFMWHLDEAKYIKRSST